MDLVDIHSIFHFEEKYVIVGFPKCGQISLETYLRGLGYDVQRHDIIWRSNASDMVKTQNPGRTPIIMTRDPIQMIWSSYFYWHYKETMSFEKYLKHKVVRESSLGNENPIDHADYEKHINKFLDMKPILLKFEDMITIEDYPHENKTEKKPTITPKYVEMIQKALDSYKSGV